MKSLLIHYFSGTGNTERAVKIIAERLEEKKYGVTLQEVQTNIMFNDCEADLHVFAFPVYAMSVPNIMLEYLNKAYTDKPAKAAVLAIHGEINKEKSIPGHPGFSPMQAQKILEEKGFEVFLTDAFGYAVSMTQMMNVPDQETIKYLNELGDEKLGVFIKHLEEETVSYYHCDPVLKAISFPFGKGYMWFGRRILSQFFIADGNCNQCHLCVKSCPAQAISFYKIKPKWSMSCEGCQRCINLCPQCAIQASIPRLVIIGGLTLLPFHKYMAKCIEKVFRFRISAYNPIILATCMLPMFLCIKTASSLLSMFEQVPSLKKIMELNYTKSFRRYHNK